MEDKAEIEEYENECTNSVCYLKSKLSYEQAQTCTVLALLDHPDYPTNLNTLAVKYFNVDYKLLNVLESVLLNYRTITTLKYYFPACTKRNNFIVVTIFQIRILRA